jgi:N-carbamoyl-L-amino-acid hydrolase
VELHIEQGAILEKDNIPIGVVDAIVGLGELIIQVKGHVAHAGTTPMNLRMDALVGASQIIVAIDRIARIRRGSVATVGTIDAVPNDPDLVSGKVTLGVEFRDSTIERLHSLRREIVSVSLKVAKQLGLKVTFHERSPIIPATMSRSVVNEIVASANSLGLRYKILHSGAGHDCQNMARITRTGMIFVPSINGISHSPNEATSPEALEIGANVLLNTLLRLAERS